MLVVMSRGTNRRKVSHHWIPWSWYWRHRFCSLCVCEGRSPMLHWLDSRIRCILPAWECSWQVTATYWLLSVFSYYGAVLPRRRSRHVLILSICLSVCPVPPPRGKTKRPTNTKLGRKGLWDTSTSWTNFKFKGSEVKVMAANCIVGKTMLSIWYDNWLCGTHVLNCKGCPIAGGPSTAAPSCLF